jgi:hypothetical protein
MTNVYFASSIDPPTQNFLQSIEEDVNVVRDYYEYQYMDE